MARMYPNQLIPDTVSDAERRLYEAFRDKLESDYTIFHGVAWQSLDTEGRPRDGEADFVIAHPQRGILVMETKGGGIRYNPSTERWTSTDRHGRTFDIKDPFAQARHGKYALQDQLQLTLNRPAHSINIGHAVAFPDVVVKGDWLGSDKPRQIILDATDLANLVGWLGQVMAYWRGPETQKETSPGDDAVQALMDLLGKEWELRPALWGEFVQEEEQFIRLTRQQYLILDVLNRQRRAAICGCAGSGKTMLAAEKASRLARQRFRVLLTCFNKNLAAELRARLKPSANLDILNFHALCYDLAWRAGVLPAKQDDDTFFNQQLPEALVEAADKLGIRYDAIVVDEGQDFRDGWWVPLQMLLRDPDNGILYIFFDDNQRIYVPHSEFPIQQSPFLLPVNCRNTQAIHEVVVQFYKAETRPTALGPRGRPVEVVSYDNLEDLWLTLQAVFRRLTVQERIPADEIAVLTPLSRTKTALLDYSASSEPHLTDTLPPGPGQLYCTTIHDFKGLERAVIILASVGQRLTQEEHDLNSLLYVGCSRACHHLIVLVPEKADPRVKKVFAAVTRRNPAPQGLRSFSAGVQPPRNLEKSSPAGALLFQPDGFSLGLLLQQSVHLEVPALAVEP